MKISTSEDEESSHGAGFSVGGGINLERFHLNVAYGADSCHRVASEVEVKVSLDRLGKTRQTGPRCPRCGAKPDCYDHQQQALSRRADIQICNRCGTEEALEDIAWGGHQNLPLADWAIVKGGWVE